MSRDRMGRDQNHRDASAVAQEVERLDIPRVIVAAAFVERDEDGSALPEILVALDAVNDLFDEAFEKIELGRCGVAINPSARLDKGDSGQGAILNIVVKIRGVLEIGALCRVGHYRGRVLEEI